MQRTGRMLNPPSRTVVAVVVAASVSVTSVPSLRAQTTKTASPAKPQGARGQQQPKPRLFQPQDLGLLEAPDRDQWNHPDQILDVLGIAPEPEQVHPDRFRIRNDDDGRAAGLQTPGKKLDEPQHVVQSQVLQQM